MCFSSPKAPPPPPEPVKPQPAQQPDVNAIYTKRKVPGAVGALPAGGTLLTGPAGLSGAVAPNLSGNTLLGSAMYPNSKMNK